MKIFWKKISIKLRRSASSASATAAETLLEAIIAISIFALILGPASALFVSSIRTVAANRNDLVASGLAEEGIEIVRNFRDTNFIKFSPKATECWNTMPGYADLTGCDTAANKIAAENFILTFDPATLAWGLSSGGGEVDTMNAKYRLKQDIPRLDCAEVNLPCDGLTFVYFTPPVASPRGTDSPFYRKIQIENINLDSNAATYEAMRVTSTVQYRAGSSVRTSQRVLILTNQPA